jgi:hypothetical protein
VAPTAADVVMGLMITIQLRRPCPAPARATRAVHAGRPVVRIEMEMKMPRPEGSGALRRFGKILSGERGAPSPPVEPTEDATPAMPQSSPALTAMLGAFREIGLCEPPAVWSHFRACLTR